MRNLIVTTFAITVIAVSSAFAQGMGSGSAAKSSTSSTSTRAGGNAPVGHRQPTAADVGSDKAATDLSPEDKALDRKIRSICRGC